MIHGFPRDGSCVKPWCHLVVAHVAPHSVDWFTMGVAFAMMGVGALVCVSGLRDLRRSRRQAGS